MQVKISDIIQNQAIINLGTIGSIAAGKSTIVADLTGKKTQRHAKEKHRNITIHLGYANCKIFRCGSTGNLYASPAETGELLSPVDSQPMELLTHISFVDCPGHENYMATMIGGTTVMDAALLLVASNEPVPMPQTYDHMLTISQTDLKDILILQNKIDLLEKPVLLENLKKIKEFVEGSPYEDSPVIPVSAQMKWNIDEICKFMVNKRPSWLDKVNEPARLCVLRSFDINYPNIELDTVHGGVVGGSLSQGNIRIGDIMEIRPGVVHNNSGVLTCTPLLAKVETINCEKTSLDIAFPGGLIGVGLSIDSSITKNNILVGHIMGHIGTLPELYQEITVKYSRIKGRNDDLPKFTVGEQVTIVVNSSSMLGVVTSIEHKHIVNIKLVSLVCTELDVPTAVFRKIDHKYKLCYFGKIVDGTPFKNIINQSNYELYSNVNEPIEIIDDLKEILVPEFNDYYQMLKVKETMKVHVEPFRIINPDIQYSNKKYFWSNYFDVLNCVAKVKESDTSDSIDQLKHLQDYISEKISCVTSLNDDNQLVIRGKINSKEIKNIINAYSCVYKTCPQCKTVDTYLIRVERMLKLKCRNCTCMHTVT